ncbi:hypothetical protein V6N13_116608 [Hibiscus sabdariffa]
MCLNSQFVPCTSLCLSAHALLGFDPTKLRLSRALPKEASGNDLSWAYAMKNDLRGKNSCAYVDGSLNFPRLEKGIFLQKMKSA